MTLPDVLLLAAGALVVLAVLDAAIRTLVLPRGVPVRFTRTVFLTLRRLFDLLARPARTYEDRDRLWALYAPIAFLTLIGVWLFTIFIGFAMIFTALDDEGWRDALVTSGSSLMTLGFERPDDLPSVFAAFTEAALGLGLVALLIAYLPTMYGAFSRREIAVNQLSVRAGTPPSAVELLQRAHEAGYVAELDALWAEWMAWFSELSETHTSFPMLGYFRSPNPHRSWVTAAGTVLDAAALRYSALNVPWTPAAGLCIRSGYLALREIAEFFGFTPDPDPRPDGPISITRDEFEAAFAQLASAGAPVRLDPEQAWRDFSGWRVNYDAVLLALAGRIMAPYAPWTSDRSPRTPMPRGRRARRVQRASGSLPR